MRLRGTKPSRAAAALAVLSLLGALPAGGQQAERVRLREELPSPGQPNEVGKVTRPDSAATRGATRGSFFSDSRVSFGSAGLVSPVTLLVNRGLSTLMYADSDRRLGGTDWGRGWANVRDAMVHPVAAIERSGGWGEVLRRELVPSGRDPWEWAFSANYAGHVVAGGITYHLAAEWFRQRGMPYPRLTGAAYMYGLILVNEIVESQGLSRGTAGTVADLYAFEPLGLLLFSFDGVARFFGRTLQAADWSPQGSIGITGKGTVLNNSQIMSYKAPLPFTDRVRALFLVGQWSSTGVQVALADGFSLGGTVGFVGAARLVDPDNFGERLVADWSGGLYLSGDNSLLASAVLGGGHHPLSVNIYPGLLPGKLGAVGLWFASDRHHGPSFGLSSRVTLGLGLGLGLGFNGGPR